MANVQPLSNRERTYSSSVDTNKVIRNTYMLLSMTLVLSAVTAGISMAIDPPFLAYLGSVILSFVLLFVLNRKQNSAAALPLTFAFTGLLGFGLGPLLNHYLALSNGGQIVTTALGMTAVTFLGLSAYALTSRKDFSFMGGFLFTGLIIALLASIGLIFFQIPALSLVVSTMLVLLAAGYILYDTSRIIHGGETNYVMATVALYVDIYMLFAHLLALLGVFSGDE